MKPRYFIIPAVAVLLASVLPNPQGLLAADPTPGSALQSANDALARRQTDLKLSQEARKRVEERLAALENQPDADPEIIRLYRLALRRLSSLEQENLDEIERLEKAGATTPPPADPVLPENFETDPFAGSLVPRTEELDTAMKLNQELDRALAEFDRELLRAGVEVEDEIAQIPEKSAGGAEGGSSGQNGGSGGAEGQNGGSEGQMAGAGGGANGESQGAEPATNGEPAGNPGGSVAGLPKPTGGGEPSGQTQTGNAGVPPGNPSGGSNQPNVAMGGNQGGGSTKGEGGGGRGPRPGAEDDDIVARQLREAAEAETDPVLKEKLWKEYEAYKNAGR